MSTGSQKLKRITRSLFPDLVPDQCTAPPEDLYEAKKQLIAARYLHHISRNNGNTYNDVLVILQKEFFLSTKQIANIIASETHTIKQWSQEKKEKSWFKTTWSHMVW